MSDRLHISMNKQWKNRINSDLYWGITLYGRFHSYLLKTPEKSVGLNETRVWSWTWQLKAWLEMTHSRWNEQKSLPQFLMAHHSLRRKTEMSTSEDSHTPLSQTAHLSEMRLGCFFFVFFSSGSSPNCRTLGFQDVIYFRTYRSYCSCYMSVVFCLCVSHVT